MNVRGTLIDDTFAEAFAMRYCRVLVTAADPHWVDVAIGEFSGYGTSIIACEAEVGRETRLRDSEAPDGRPGASALLFAFSTAAVGKTVANRAGQCLLTCPTAAAYDGLPEASDRVPLGRHVRFFGDGFQKSKVIGGRRYWRVPIMSGEFLVEDTVGVEKGVAGGNIIVQGETPSSALAAARRAVDAVDAVAGVITPFPGGVVSSGSKVGSRYRGLRASTYESFCPATRTRSATKLHPDATCAYEVVFDGVNEETVAAAMRTATFAATGPGVPLISAGNYGGKLGKFLISLHEVLS